MKIEGNPPNLDPSATERSDRTQGDVKQAAREKETRQPGTTDRVDVSSDVELANAAVKAASDDLPKVRPDLVAEAKAMLNDGSLGADAGTLADSIIERLKEQ